jgi:hypothetical protein
MVNNDDDYIRVWRAEIIAEILPDNLGKPAEAFSEGST